MTMIGAVCAALIVLPLWLPLSMHAQAPGQNLLTDGDFEASNWRVQDEISALQVAPGWRAWYLDIEQIPSYVTRPNNCKGADLGCYWARPEYHDAFAELNPNRVHSGAKAQKYYSYGRMHEAGLYQKVEGVKPGTTLRFSIYLQAWMCYNIDACGKGGILSDAPSDMHLRIGIDPYGGADPFSANIVWSPETPAFDRWVEFAVEAQAKGDAVTVFTHSRADWDWARNNNDVYLDDASLVVVEKERPSATLAPTTLPGSPAPTQPPAATRTPRPDGAIIHVIRPGDSMYAISLEYGVPLDELYKLNNLTRTSVLNIGQEIIVKAPPGVVITLATATRTAQATAIAQVKATATVQAKTAVTSPLTPTAALPTLAPTAAPSATPIPQGLCLSAFDDLNGNTLRDGNEPGLAGVTFSILSAGIQVARYATDSSGLPTCLTQLPPGAFSVLVQLPPGYIAPFEKTDVTLTAAQRVNLALPARKGEQPTPTKSPTVEAQPVQPTPGRSNTTLIVLILIAAAILMIVVAAIAAIRRGR
jgi:LysM repeat protein